MATVLLFTAVLLLFVDMWILYHIWRGRNWARIAQLVLVLGGMLMIVPAAIDSGSPPHSAWEIAAWVWKGAVPGLLFLTPGRRWFLPRPADHIPPPVSA